MLAISTHRREKALARKNEGKQTPSRASRMVVFKAISTLPSKGRKGSFKSFDFIVMMDTSQKVNPHCSEFFYAF